MSTDYLYTLCAECDHFIEPNVEEDIALGCAEYTHLDNGEKDHDHDARPSNLMATLDEWEERRPDLFIEHSDGNIGPNSHFHIPKER